MSMLGVRPPRQLDYLDTGTSGAEQFVAQSLGGGMPQMGGTGGGQSMFDFNIGQQLAQMNQQQGGGLAGMQNLPMQQLLTALGGGKSFMFPGGLGAAPAAMPEGIGTAVGAGIPEIPDPTQALFGDMNASMVPSFQEGLTPDIPAMAEAAPVADMAAAGAGAVNPMAFIAPLMMSLMRRR